MELNFNPEEILKKKGKFKRIIAHTDFDGLISALILRQLFDIDYVRFSEPWVINQKLFPVYDSDIIVDLPPHENCGLWLDHHSTNKNLIGKISLKAFAFDETKKSCPSLIKEVFGEAANLNKFAELIKSADKIDSASFTYEELLNPDDAGKISISLNTFDKRKDDEFRLYLLNLLSFKSIHEVVKDKNVKNRIEIKLKDRREWRKKIKDKVKKINKVLLIDLTDETDFPFGNKLELSFMYPEQKYFLIIEKTKNDPNLLKISLGRTILNPPKPSVHLGNLAAELCNGGGHEAAAGCAIEKKDKEKIISLIVEKLNS